MEGSCGWSSEGGCFFLLEERLSFWAALKGEEVFTAPLLHKQRLFSPAHVSIKHFKVKIGIYR